MRGISLWKYERSNLSDARGHYFAVARVEYVYQHANDYGFFPAGWDFYGSGDV